jgi:multidrug resistance protein
MDSKSKEMLADQDSDRSQSIRLASVGDSNDAEKDVGGTEKQTQRPASIRSGTSSIYDPPPIVPRHQRRGLLARLALVPETTIPTHYPRKTKWTITFTVAIAAAAAPTGSATIMPALQEVSNYFHTSDTITNLSMALYMLAMSIFPLWWSSFSETLGRRTIYIVSFTFYTIFAVLASVSTNISMLIVTRILAGGSAASVQAVGAGTIADIWEPKERGKAMGFFYLGPLCGPLFAPIIGGALAHGFGWRATQWFLVIFGAVVTIGLILLLPETLTKRKPVLENAAPEEKGKIASETAVAGTIEVNPAGTTQAVRENQQESTGLERTTTRQSVRVKTKRTVKFLKRAFVDPLKIILLLRFPAVALTVYYASITFGSLYFLNISIETAFSSPPYNFSALIVGLLYIPGSLGYFLASIFGGRWLDIIMKREARKKGRIDVNGKLMLRPEDRMKENAWLACFLFPAALITFGWLVEYGVFFVYPVCNCYMLDFTMLIILAHRPVFLWYWIDVDIRHGNNDVD